MKKFLSWLLLAFLSLGSIFFFPSNLAEARQKTTVRKIIRKISPKRKIIRKKIIKKRIIHKKRKAKRKTLRPRLTTPKIISQRYLIEEGLDELEADRIKDSLKIIGVKEVETDVNENTIYVKFNPRKVSAITIIQKLKNLGFTTKRIN